MDADNSVGNHSPFILVIIPRISSCVWDVIPLKQYGILDDTVIIILFVPPFSLFLKLSLLFDDILLLYIFYLQTLKSTTLPLFFNKSAEPDPI